MTKLKDLRVIISECAKTSRKIGNNYEEAPMISYDIRKLPQLNETNLSSKLFLDEDFVVPPKENGRYWVKAKIGKLYLEWIPDGKGSFSLNIKFIDKQNRTLRSFLNLQNPRHSNIEFEDLLPFSLDAYYYDRTGNPRRSARFAREQRSCAYELKMTLTKLLLGETPTADELRKFQENYRKLYIIGNSVQPDEPIKKTLFQPLKDITYFGLNSHKKPATLFEVSAKIGAIALNNLSINEKEIGDVLMEYLEVTGKNLDIFDKKEVQLEILTTLIDKGRVPLKSIVDDIEPLLQNAICSLNRQHRAARYFSCNDFTLNNKTGAEIDQWLQDILYQDLSLKERKKGYLVGLECIINDLKPEQKKSLGLCILNNPNHFLKKERGFLRSLEYSNDTYSIFRVVKKLMLGEQKNNTLIINDDEHHQDHVLSRHV
ncbi:hypothetical protein [Legionella cherrii]|uniref:Uncharacterized protein n=1 Tax=Legionella cherrii TaxID=28084 RepID=A0ABY6T7C5_9GAMM|nr:hypothetical protein [Legionella cherrii]VEB37583.1 Uncharacterised protein [Legionella cherrii]